MKRSFVLLLILPFVMASCAVTGQYAGSVRFQDGIYYKAGETDKVKDVIPNAAGTQFNDKVGIQYDEYGWSTTTTGSSIVPVIIADPWSLDWYYWSRPYRYGYCYPYYYGYGWDPFFYDDYWYWNDWYCSPYYYHYHHPYHYHSHSYRNSNSLYAPHIGTSAGSSSAYRGTVRRSTAVSGGIFSATRSTSSASKVRRSSVGGGSSSVDRSSGSTTYRRPAQSSSSSSSSYDRGSSSTFRSSGSTSRSSGGSSYRGSSGSHSGGGVTRRR